MPNKSRKQAALTRSKGQALAKVLERGDEMVEPTHPLSNKMLARSRKILADRKKAREEKAKQQRST